MLRVLGYIVLVALIVAGAVWMAERPGDVTLVWQGWRVDTSVPILLLAILVVVAIIWAVLRILRGIGAIPGVVRESVRDKRRKRGLSALGSGYAAVAAGDARRARSYAGDAEKLLDAPQATRLLAAQAALLSGDGDDARKRFEALLDDSDTELPALRGLMDQALASGDRVRAREYAERAFAKGRPAWAGETLFNLQAGNGEYEAAQGTLDAGAKAGIFTGERLNTLRATLLIARAEGALANGALWEGVKLAKQAHDSDPGFVPAALLLARAYKQDNKERKAAHVIETTWKRSPHPDLGAAYLALFEEEGALKRSKRADALAQVNPEARESRLLSAEAALDAELWGQARAKLKPLTEEPVGPRFARLMARVEEGEMNDTKAALDWLKRAADNAASGDRSAVPPHWQCESCSHVPPQWAPTCPACGTFASVTWQGPARALVPVSQPASAA
ncbi:hypothetical protein C882_3262 [Caenispirillum salinarum AK4]|uniref:HemY N-terminal domain-containing protein n=1 Tax=Caenispirillum salinarum AK4 TaxID=1238182 RepID=K9HPL1_9PROT|nr:heme biosynthesis HemY N-terminal domain-containing protein [Caenispirillum salinarum]EKV32198.1 hypothetical protein C882_3262 [Caenispirillum salinarum AK4]